MAEDVETIDDLHDMELVEEPEEAEDGVGYEKPAPSPESEPLRPAMEIVEPAKPPTQYVHVAVQEQLQMHACGLPKVFMDKKAGRGEVARYIAKHGVTHDMRQRMRYTEFERKAYDAYKASGGRVRMAKDYFVAALRLWRGGFPLSPEKPMDIHALAIEDKV